MNPLLAPARQKEPRELYAGHGWPPYYRAILKKYNPEKLKKCCAKCRAEVEAK